MSAPSASISWERVSYEERLYKKVGLIDIFFSKEERREEEEEGWEEEKGYSLA